MLVDENVVKCRCGRLFVVRDWPSRCHCGRMAHRGLGDWVSHQLARVGITKERVSAWLGRMCLCKRRQERLNKLWSWRHGK